MSYLLRTFGKALGGEGPADHGENTCANFSSIRASDLSTAPAPLTGICHQGIAHVAITRSLQTEMASHTRLSPPLVLPTCVSAVGQDRQIIPVILGEDRLARDRGAKAAGRGLMSGRLSADGAGREPPVCAFADPESDTGRYPGFSTALREALKRLLWPRRHEAGHLVITAPIPPYRRSVFAAALTCGAGCQLTGNGPGRTGDGTTARRCADRRVDPARILTRKPNTAARSRLRIFRRRSRKLPLELHDFVIHRSTAALI